MKRVSICAVVVGLLGSAMAGMLTAGEAPERPVYVVAISAATRQDAEWRQVAEVLVAKHAGRLMEYHSPVSTLQPALRALAPEYVCFVARPEEATREFVAELHRLTRQLDDDPYPDCYWGILTGYNARNALAIAQVNAPLRIRKVAAGTELALDRCEEGVCYDELKSGRILRKAKEGQPTESTGPADSTGALVQTLNEYAPDLFATSGHATEHDWQIGYAYRNGQFRCTEGVLFGLDTQGRKYPIHSPNPKVYLPIGNCLMGHIDGRDSLVLAFMNSAGVCQMIGYTVPTWYGYMGWGLLDYFVEQPGRYTLTEAFRANATALIDRLQRYFPDLPDASIDAAGRTSAPIRLSDAARQAGLTANDGPGLLFDRDVVAFYGDPAWEARMADRPKAWDQTLEVRGNTYTFEIKPGRGERTFEPINKNGVQRGGRPIIAFLPHRVKAVQILEGADLHPVVADDFLLVPNPRTCDPNRRYRVVFRASTPKLETAAGRQ